MTGPIHRDSGDAHSEWFRRLIRFLRAIVGAAVRRRGQRVHIQVWLDEDHRLQWEVDDA